MILKVNGSGSKGNGYALITDKEVLLIDAGVHSDAMLRSINFNTKSVAGLLVTHCHQDHVKYLQKYKRYGIRTYASKEVGSELYNNKSIKSIHLKRMKKHFVGQFKVTPFSVPHNDTECDGFLIEHDDFGKLVFITDAEYCPYDFSKQNINHIMIECNYCKEYTAHEDMANFEHVIRGHMELETTKRFVEKLNSENVRSVGLLHLSSVNGDPDRFRQEVEEIVDKDVNVYTAEIGRVVELKQLPF